MRVNIPLYAILLVIAAIILTACGGEVELEPTATNTATITPRPTSTETPNPTNTATASPTSTSTSTLTPTITPIECNINDVLKNLESKLTYSSYELFYTNYSIVGDSYFNVWYVDPEIDPDASDTEMEENFLLAIQNAIELSHKLVLADECIGELVSAGINPVVVDKNYNGWFSGVIPIDKFPSTIYLTDANRKEIISSLHIQYVRQTPPEPIGEPPDSFCRWTDANESIRKHFPPDQPNMVFYQVRDGNGTNLYAQWVAPEGVDGVQAVAISVASVMNILFEIQCLHPSVDNLYAFAVDNNGDLVFLGNMSGEAISQMDIEKLEIQYP